MRTHRNTVNCHEEQLLRLDHVEEKFKIEKNVLENLLFCDPEVNIVIVGMRTVVDDAVHVQVEIVELGHLQEEIWWMKLCALFQRSFVM